MNAQWQKLPSAEFRRPQSVSGSVATFYPSPFEIPDAFRGLVDKSTGELVVEFRYLDDGEPTKEVGEAGGIRAKIGKNSARLFEVRIPVSLIQTAITETLSKQRAAAETLRILPTRRVGHAVRDNYRVAQEVLEKSEFSLSVP
jgi:hypothetical protein